MTGVRRTFAAALVFLGLTATPCLAAETGVNLAVLPLENASGEKDFFHFLKGILRFVLFFFTLFGAPRPGLPVHAPVYDWAVNRRPAISPSGLAVAAGALHRSAPVGALRASEHGGGP